MNYVDLFSGIGGFSLAIRNIVPDAKCVGFSEIDPYAIKIYQKHFPSHTTLGQIETAELPADVQIDLACVSWPCTDLSISNVANLGLEGARSGLIYDSIRFLEKYRPKDFVFENVASMKTKNVAEITRLLGVEPVLLNARDVSAQNRERLFWASFPITPLPKADPTPRLLDLLLDPVLTGAKLYLSDKEIAYMDRKVAGGRSHWDFGHHHDSNKDKSHCLPANLHKGVPYNVLLDRRLNGTLSDGTRGVARKLDCIEAERLMGFPDNWTEGVSTSRRLKALGNAVSIKVIEHIMGCYRESLH